MYSIFVQAFFFFFCFNYP